MNDIIATIKLALGEVGFYDPLSGIHLSIGNPIAYVRAGVNTSRLQSSVRSGRLVLVEGSLGNPPPEPISFAPRIAAESREIPGEEKVETPVVSEVTEAEKEAIRAAMEETKVAEESVEEETTEEETVEESSNEPETEKKSKKKKKK